jgi:ferredoxin
VTVLRVTLSAYLAADDIECGKQGRCSVSHVIVRPGAAATLFERQSRLSAIQRLDLRLFIGTEHNGVLRRIQIDADYIEQFSDKVPIT